MTQYPVHPPTNPDEYESAEAPVIGLARGDPNPRSRANSRASTHTVKTSRSLKNFFTEPILTSKKEYMTEEGYPRTEFVWRHPPVFQDAIGRVQPVTIAAGLGDPNAPPQQFLEDGIRNTEPIPGPRDEESLLFRDSGYGSLGMLPGLSSFAPMSDSRYKNDGDVVGDYGERVGLGTVGDDGQVGSAGGATKAPKRMQERRRSSAASKSAGMSERRASLSHVGDLVRGMNGVQV